jgi:hypothetical protein
VLHYFRYGLAGITDSRKHHDQSSCALSRSSDPEPEGTLNGLFCEGLGVAGYHPLFPLIVQQIPDEKNIADVILIEGFPGITGYGCPSLQAPRGQGDVTGDYYILIIDRSTIRSSGSHTNIKCGTDFYGRSVHHSRGLYLTCSEPGLILHFNEASGLIESKLRKGNSWATRSTKDSRRRS